MLSFFAGIIILIPLHIKRRESPTNLILLTAFVSSTFSKENYFLFEKF